MGQVVWCTITLTVFAVFSLSIDHTHTLASAYIPVLTSVMSYLLLLLCLKEQWVESSGLLENWRFITSYTDCLAIAICRQVSTKSAVGVWKKVPLEAHSEELILSQSFFKDKHVTHSYMHIRDRSHLLSLVTYSLTFCFSLLPALGAGKACKINTDFWQAAMKLLLHLPAWFVVMFTAEKWGV